MGSLKLKVAGMTCDHCRHSVEQALKGVPGTFGAAVFLEDGEAEQVRTDGARHLPGLHFAPIVCLSARERLQIDGPLEVAFSRASA